MTLRTGCLPNQSGEKVDSIQLYINNTYIPVHVHTHRLACVYVHGTCVITSKRQERILTKILDFGVKQTWV